MLLNDGFVRNQAHRFADRLVRERPNDARGQVKRAYWLALSRTPTDKELAAALVFLAAQQEKKSRLANFCQVLLTLNEFVYVD